MVQLKGLVFSTIGEGFRAYIRALETDLTRPSNAVSLARTAVLKFTVPGLGGPSPAGKRMLKAEQEAALSFLDRISTDQLATCLKAQQQVLEALDTTSDIRKTNRYQLSLFLDWMHEQTLAHAVEMIEAEERRQQSSGQTRVFHKSPYVLREHQTPEPLKADLQAFKHFCQTHLRLTEGTYDDRTDHICRLLGWLHHVEKEEVETLSFTRVIPLVRLTPLETDLTPTQRFIEQHRLDDDGAEAAQSVTALLDRYFDFHANSLSTQVLITESLLLLTKFVYRDEIQRLGLTHSSEINRIPVIRRLRQILDDRQGALQAAPPVVPHESHSIPWETTVQVLNRLREKFDRAVEEYEASRRVTGKYQGQPTRSRHQLGRYLQTFLVVGFFVILPPDRPRTVRELELGRTLKQGLIQSGTFIPVDRLPLKSEARWYIHLGPQDYKTGKYYGESWVEVPDMPLSNGVGFYHYLNLWISDFRLSFHPNHQVLFVTTKAIHGATVGDRLCTGKLTQKIRDAFQEQVGVPVVPQAFRKMFVTYLKSSGAEEHILEGAAVAMHHSREIQERVYDQQPHPEKIQPILDFNLQLFELVFVAEEQPLPLTDNGQIDFPLLTTEQRQLLLEGLEREAKRRRLPIKV